MRKLFGLQKCLRSNTEKMSLYPQTGQIFFLFFFLAPLALAFKPNVLKPDVSSLSFLRPMLDRVKNIAVAFLPNCTSEQDIQCLADIIHTTDKFKEKEIWPYYMLDATGYFGPGMYHGNNLYLGSWEECLNYRLREDYRVAQYCLLSVDFVNATDLKQFGMFLEPRASRYHMGVCVPESCQLEFFNKFLQTVRPNFLKAQVNDGDCHKRNETKPLTDFNWVVIGVLSALAAIIILSTSYDLWLQFWKTIETPKALLCSFSVLSNSGRVLDVESTPDTLEAVVGVKGFAIQYVVYIHLFILLFMGNTSDAMYARVLAYNNEMASGIFTNAAFFSPDTFLFLSGAMIVLSFYKQIETKGYYDPIMQIINRYFRFTVPLALLMLVRMGLSEQLGEGPVYNLFNSQHQRNCNKTYLSTLLGYANYAHLPHEMCFVQSWYTALDLQLVIVSQIILILAVKFPQASVILTVVFGVVTTCVTFVVAYVKDVGPTPFIDRYLSNFKYDFAYAHTRGSSWFFGMVFGFILKKCLVKPPTITKNRKWLGWLLAKVLLIACVHILYNFDYINYKQPASALFLALYRIAWAAAVGWIVFAISFGHAGPIGALLKWGPIQFIGNLSFEVYLWHVPVIEYVISSARETWHITQFKIWSHFYSVLCYSLILAVPTAIILTIPLKIISTQLQDRVRLITITRDEIDAKMEETDRGVVNEGFVNGSTDDMETTTL